MMFDKLNESDSILISPDKRDEEEDISINFKEEYGRLLDSVNRKVEKSTPSEKGLVYTPLRDRSSGRKNIDFRY
jgi:hypothetical protein